MWPGYGPEVLGADDFLVRPYLPPRSDPPRASSIPRRVYYFRPDRCPPEIPVYPRGRRRGNLELPPWGLTAGPALCPPRGGGGACFETLCFGWKRPKGAPRARLIPVGLDRFLIGSRVPYSAAAGLVWGLGSGLACRREDRPAVGTPVGGLGLGGWLWTAAAARGCGRSNRSAPLYTRCMAAPPRRATPPPTGRQPLHSNADRG